MLYTTSRVERTPTRTREHHIADLSLNHVERFVLGEGFTVDGKRHDYGYDLILNTYNFRGDPTFARGDSETGEVLIQLKATDKLSVLRNGVTISFPISVKHLDLWQNEVMPVILIVFDVKNTKAYWLYIQKYLLSAKHTRQPGQKKVSVHLSMNNIVDSSAIQQFRSYKETVEKRAKKGGRLHA